MIALFTCGLAMCQASTLNFAMMFLPRSPHLLGSMWLFNHSFQEGRRGQKGPGSDDVDSGNSESSMTVDDSATPILGRLQMNSIRIAISCFIHT